MTEHRHRPTIADMVVELTQHHTHVETYQVKSLTGPGWVDARHITTVPSLIQQLWDNDTPSASAEEGPRPGFQSKPAARLDALDAATRIDLQASRWIHELGETDRHLDTGATVRQLHSLAASADQVTRRAIEHDVRSWWTQARIVTGWDSPPWIPDATCPVCAERGTLKVRLTEKIAMCTNDVCRTTWDETCIGLLADHIRSESMAERSPRRGPGPCVCPLPRPTLPDDGYLDYLCPRCGSASCTNALQRRLIETLRATAQDGRIGA